MLSIHLIYRSYLARRASLASSSLAGGWGVSSPSTRAAMAVGGRGESTRRQGAAGRTVPAWAWGWYSWTWVGMTDRCRYRHNRPKVSEGGVGRVIGWGVRNRWNGIKYCNRIKYLIFFFYFKWNGINSK